MSDEVEVLLDDEVAEFLLAVSHLTTRSESVPSLSVAEVAGVLVRDSAERLVAGRVLVDDDLDVEAADLVALVPETALAHFAAVLGGDC